MLCFGESVNAVSNTRRSQATLGGSGRAPLPFVLLGLAGAALSIACHGAAQAQAPASQAGAGAAGNAGSFNLWKELVAWLSQFGPAGFVLVVVLAFLGWVVSQAGNLEKVMGWLRPTPEEPPPAEPSSPAQQPAMPSEPSTSISVSSPVSDDMTDFLPIDEVPALVYIDRVQGCDGYLGTFWMRYDCPVRHRPDVSCNELVFDTPTAISIPRLVFLLDTDADDQGFR